MVRRWMMRLSALVAPNRAFAVEIVGTDRSRQAQANPDACSRRRLPVEGKHGGPT